jgi:predicted RNA-binding Zn-ribbon protein involved in translation (DUF1610 family)
MNPKQILKTIQSNLIASILVGTTTGLASFLLWSENWFASLLPTDIRIAFVRLLAITLLLLGLVGSYFYSKRKFKSRYNVLWDKKNNIYCNMCKVMLAPAHVNKEQWSHFLNRTSFSCPKCGQLYLLKDETDRPISKQRCIEAMKEEHT